MWSASSSTTTSTRVRSAAPWSIRSISRPGVATTMSTPRSNALSCGPYGMPPATSVRLRPWRRASGASTSATWSASSRVGTSTRDRAQPAGALEPDRVVIIGKPEAERLARPRLPAAEHVPAGERVRDGGGLDRERLGDATGVQGRDQNLGHTELGEATGGRQRRGRRGRHVLRRRLPAHLVGLGRRGLAATPIGAIGPLVAGAIVGTPVLLARTVVGRTVAARPVVGRPIRAGTVVRRTVAARPVVGRPIRAGTVVRRTVTARPVIGRPIRARTVIRRTVAARPVIRTADPTANGRRGCDLRGSRWTGDRWRSGHWPDDRCGSRWTGGRCSRTGDGRCARSADGRRCARCGDDRCGRTDAVRSCASPNAGRRDARSCAPRNRGCRSCALGTAVVVAAALRTGGVGAGVFVLAPGAAARRAVALAALGRRPPLLGGTVGLHALGAFGGGLLVVGARGRTRGLAGHLGLTSGPLSGLVGRHVNGHGLHNQLGGRRSSVPSSAHLRPEQADHRLGRDHLTSIRRVAPPRRREWYEVQPRLRRTRVIRSDSTPLKTSWCSMIPMWPQSGSRRTSAPGSSSMICRCA